MVHPVQDSVQGPQPGARGCRAARGHGRGRPRPGGGGGARDAAGLLRWRCPGGPRPQRRGEVRQGRGGGRGGGGAGPAPRRGPSRGAGPAPVAQDPLPQLLEPGVVGFAQGRHRPSSCGGLSVGVGEDSSRHWTTTLHGGYWLAPDEVRPLLGVVRVLRPGVPPISAPRAPPSPRLFSLRNHSREPSLHTLGRPPPPGRAPRARGVGRRDGGRDGRRSRGRGPAAGQGARPPAVRPRPPAGPGQGRGRGEGESRGGQPPATCRVGRTVCRGPPGRQLSGTEVERSSMPSRAPFASSRLPSPFSARATRPAGARRPHQGARALPVPVELHVRPGAGGAGDRHRRALRGCAAGGLHAAAGGPGLVRARHAPSSSSSSRARGSPAVAGRRSRVDRGAAGAARALPAGGSRAGRGGGNPG